jgi:hypothetical protein
MTNCQTALPCSRRTLYRLRPRQQRPNQSTSKKAVFAKFCNRFILHNYDAPPTLSRYESHDSNASALCAMAVRALRGEPFPRMAKPTKNTLSTRRLAYTPDKPPCLRCLLQLTNSTAVRAGFTTPMLSRKRSAQIFAAKQVTTPIHRAQALCPPRFYAGFCRTVSRRPRTGT